MDLVEGDAVVPLVTIVDVCNFNMRHNAGYQFGDVSQAVDSGCSRRRLKISPATTAGSSLHAKHECSRSIVDMEERPPLLTIEYGDLTGGGCSGGQ